MRNEFVPVDRLFHIANAPRKGSRVRGASERACYARKLRECYSHSASSGCALRNLQSPGEIIIGWMARGTPSLFPDPDLPDKCEASQMRKRSIIPILYIAFLLLPIYWLVAMSFKTTDEILSGYSLFPQTFTLENYRVIFTDPTWYWGYINSILYVSINTVISVAVALPAAYAFSTLPVSRRQAPVLLVADEPDGRRRPFLRYPFFQLYSAVGLFDTHIWPSRSRIACLTFLWRSGSLRGFMSRRTKGTGRNGVCRRLFVPGASSSRYSCR